MKLKSSSFYSFLRAENELNLNIIKIPKLEGMFYIVIQILSFEIDTVISTVFYIIAIGKCLNISTSIHDTHKKKNNNKNKK